MDAEDLRWIARKIDRLGRDHLAAIVAEARLTDPSDADYLVNALLERREAILAVARRTGPLWDPGEG